MYPLRILLACWCVCSGLAEPAWGQNAPPAIEWQRTYGGALNDILHSVHQTADGGYVLGGRSISDPGGTKTAGTVRNYDYWLVRVDANGQQLWDRSYGGTMYDKICSVVQTPDGGFLLAGYSESPADGNKTSPAFGPRDYWVVRTDANGQKLWERTYGGTGGETLHVMRPTPDGGYILGGTSNSSTSGNKTSPNYGWNSHDFWLVRITANGDILWNRTFGSNSDDFLHSVELTADGGFIVGGTAQVGASGNKTSGNFGGPDYWVLRLDASGNKLWEQSYGGWGTDDLYAAVPTADGGFLLGGYSDSPPSGVKTAPIYGGVDVWLVRLDADGNTLWDQSHGGNSHDNFMDSFSMRRLPDGGFIFGTGTGGWSSGGNKSAPNYGGVDMWAVRLDAAGNELWEWSAGAADTDVINALQMTSDGGFVFVGQSYSDVGGNKTAPRQGGADYWMVKVASDRPVINTLPTVSAFTDQVFLEDQAGAPIPFTVDDAETAAAALVVSGHSSNNTLLPEGSIAFGGTGAARTVTLVPAPNRSGTARVSVVVTDAHGGRATNGFQVTVQEINDPPSIGGLADLTLAKNTTSSPLAVVISDPETAPASLILTVTSSNPGLLPVQGLVLGGAGADRTLQIAPAPGQTGEAEVTLTVQDGQLGASSTFLVSVEEVVLPPPNLISHWKLDETSGNVVIDVTGRNPGLLVNGPERVAGKLGNGLRFNGVNNFVNIPDSASLDLGSRLAISFWFKPSMLLNASTGRRDLFKKFIAYWLIMNYPSQDGKLSFVLNSGAPVLTSTTTQWLPTQWYHVAATYDGAVLRLYINGTLENSMAANVTPSINGYPVQFGGNSEQAIYFPGLIDDVRIYSTSLSAAEVGALAGATPVPNTPPQISVPSDQTVAEDASSLELPFDVSDNETAPGNLAVTVTSSNPGLLAAVQLGGSGSDRTVRLTPAANQSGSAIITLTAQDEQGATRSAEFQLTVQPVNDPPVLSAIEDQLIEQGRSTGPLGFVVSDLETPAGQLTLRGVSSNQTLAPDAALAFGGSGAQRTLSIAPVPGQIGAAQITVYLSDGQVESSVSFQLTVVQTNAPGAETPFVTSTATGSPRNNFTGLVGYRIIVGPEPIQVTALGRFVFSGDKESHVVKIVRAANGTDVPGASAQVSMLGAAAGQWKFVALPSPVTLQAGESYYVVSEERLGGDHFGDLNTTIQTTGVALQNSGVYAVNAPHYIVVAGPSLTYGPPNFRYRKAGAGEPPPEEPPIEPPPVPTVELQAPIGGTTFTLPTNITLRAVISAGVTNVEFYRGTILIGRDTHSPATFVWSDPIVGEHSLTAKATDTNGAVAVSSTVTITVRTNEVVAPPPQPGGQAFIVSKVLGEIRNDFSGFVGMKITVGPQALLVKELGRIIGPGNNGTHLVKLVRAWDLADVPNGAVSINTAGGTAGEFRYQPLPAPVTLQPGAMYYVVSQEVQGGDRWHGVVGTTMATLNLATVNSGVFMGSGYGWSLAGAAAHSYGPVDFKCEVLAAGGGGGYASLASSPEPAAAVLLAWRHQGQILVNVTGLAGQHHVLECSDDLLEWSHVAEHTLERDQITIVDVVVDQARHPRRFYRSISAPPQP